MGKNSKTGGLKPSATISPKAPKVKPDIFFEPRMLTPSEQNFLRQDLRQTVEAAKRTKVRKTSRA